MSTLKPISISKVEPNELSAEWADGFKSTISLEKFRDECPCAQCKEDKVKEKKFAFPLLKTFVQGKYEIKELKLIGNYALKAVWGDGHDTGIYDWELTREIFEKYSDK
ncbi:MAG: DUF971 domain-containing protein [FCB group bacterium]|jgi:DUF971 family protein